MCEVPEEKNVIANGKDMMAKKHVRVMAMAIAGMAKDRNLLRKS